MVRLVFRPYTQVWRSICTSEPLRASTRVSSGFALLRHSSPSFGSQQPRSHSNPATRWRRIGRRCAARPPKPGRAPALASASPESLAFTFIALERFAPPLDSRRCCTPWSVFQDGSNGADGSPSHRSTGRETSPARTRTPTPDTASSLAARRPNEQKRSGLPRPREARAAGVETGHRSPRWSGAGRTDGCKFAYGRNRRPAALPARRPSSAPSRHRAWPAHDRRECGGARRSTARRASRECPARDGRRHADPWTRRGPVRLHAFPS